MTFGVRAAVLSVLVLGTTPALRGEPVVEAREIVEKLDKLYKSESSRGRMEMEIVTPHWSRTLVMRMWSKGMEKALVKVLSPKKERGVATLKLGGEMWNYLPKTNKVIKIPPSMMMGSWMGSDFTNDDLVREYTFTEDYRFEMFSPEEAADSLYYVKALPREGRPIVWGKVVVAVRTSDYQPVWEKFYDENGKVMRTMFFGSYKEFDSRTIPAEIELVPRNEEGRTIVRYLEMEFDIELDNSVFSLRNLRTPPGE